MIRLKRFLAGILCLSISLVSFGIPASNVSAAKIKLNKKKLTLTIGKSYQLKISGINKKKITWKSSNKKIATVSKFGKVKAIKKGTAKITAKINSQKYTCKVTIKKPKQTATAAPPETNPVSTAAPEDTSTLQTDSPPLATENAPTAEPDDPEPTIDISNAVTILPTTTEDYEPDALAQKITIKAQKLYEHILLIIKNENTEWLDSIDMDYTYYDEEENVVASDSLNLNSMKPNETQYICTPISDNISSINLEKSIFQIYVTQTEAYGYYTDQHAKTNATLDSIDGDSDSVTLHLENTSDSLVNGNYTVYFYDDAHNLVDAFSNTFLLTENNTLDEDIPLPYAINQDTQDPYLLATNCKVSYVAHSFTEVDPLEELAGNISITAEKFTNTVLLTVTNNNKQGVSTVDISYDYYDAEDTYLSSGYGSLLSMLAGETQYIVMEAPDDKMEEIDLEHCVPTVTITDYTDFYTYSKSNSIKASTTIEDNNYLITFNNSSNLLTEGSYIIYFYDKNKKIIDAFQNTFSVYGLDSTEEYVTGPYSYDENGEIIPLAASYSIVITAHNVMESES